MASFGTSIKRASSALRKSHKEGAEMRERRQATLRAFSSLSLRRTCVCRNAAECVARKSSLDGSTSITIAISISELTFSPNLAPEIFQCHKLQTPSGGRPPIKQLRKLERHRIEVEWNLWKILPRKWNWCLLEPEVVFDFT